MVGLILALVMGVIFTAGMAGDAGAGDPKGPTAAEIREQEQKRRELRVTSILALANLKSIQIAGSHHSLNDEP